MGNYNQENGRLQESQEVHDPKNNQTGIIYHYQFPQINCPSAYIGGSGRSLGERVMEHFKAPLPSTFTAPPLDTRWTQNNST